MARSRMVARHLTWTSFLARFLPRHRQRMTTRWFLTCERQSRSTNLSRLFVFLYAYMKPWELGRLIAVPRHAFYRMPRLKKLRTIIQIDYIHFSAQRSHCSPAQHGCVVPPRQATRADGDPPSQAKAIHVHVPRASPSPRRHPVFAVMHGISTARLRSEPTLDEALHARRLSSFIDS